MCVVVGVAASPRAITIDSGGLRAREVGCAEIHCGGY